MVETFPTVIMKNSYRYSNVIMVDGTSIYFYKCANLGQIGCMKINLGNFVLTFVALVLLCRIF